MPIAVGFVAEQLRIVAADHVLSARDLDSSTEVAELPAADQEAIVLTILRREMGIMALAAIVVCVLSAALVARPARTEGKIPASASGCRRKGSIAQVRSDRLQPTPGL